MVSSASGAGKGEELPVNQRRQNILSQHTQINSKILKDLNIRHDTIKLLEKNISKAFSDINGTNVFLGQSPKSIEIKAKIDKWKLIKLINFCTAKETINKVKKTTYGLGENNCKECKQQGLNLQNIQTAYLAQ